MMTELLLASIAMVLLTFANAEYDVKKYCQLISLGTKMPSLDSCQVYYTCMGGDMVVESSCQSNEVFDKDAQSCVPQSQSNCFYGLANPCYNKHNQFTYCSKGCNWYNYCVNGEIAWNYTCLEGQRFYAANSSCINGNCDSKEDADVPDMCNIMQEGVFFGDFENCRVWHKCVAMNQVSGECEHPLVYDVVSGACLANDGNMCRRTDKVNDGQGSGPPQTVCTNTTQVVADKNICSLYYACEVDTRAPANSYRWVPKSCSNQYFDVISKTCTGTLAARVFPGCDRCQLKTGYTRTYWTNAVDPNCAQYFTCENGRRIGIGSCKTNAFFDEAGQGCNEALYRLQQYTQNNGACQDYKCNEERQCSMAGDESTTEPPEVSSTEESNNKPEENTVKPEENTVKPEENTVKPEESAVKPEEDTPKPNP